MGGDEMRENDSRIKEDDRTQCPVCGLDVSSKWNYCPKCGTLLIRQKDIGMRRGGYYADSCV